jgi:amino-acid N-acetyltransferase
MGDEVWIQEIELRNPTEKDLPAVKELLDEVDLPSEGLEDYFCDVYVLAISKKRLVGVAGVEVYGSYGLLRSVAISPKLQRKRVGEHLVLERLEWAVKNGLESIYLLTTTAPRFFERVGFQVTKREHVPGEVQSSSEFSSICPESATAMVLDLQNWRKESFS